MKVAARESRHFFIRVLLPTWVHIFSTYRHQFPSWKHNPHSVKNHSSRLSTAAAAFGTTFFLKKFGRFGEKIYLCKRNMYLQ